MYKYDATGRLHLVEAGIGNYLERNAYDETGQRVVRVDAASTRSHYFGGGAVELRAGSLIRYLSFGGRIVAREEDGGHSGLLGSTTYAAEGGLRRQTRRASIAAARRPPALPWEQFAFNSFIVLAFVTTMILVALADSGRPRLAATTVGLLIWMIVPLPALHCSRFARTLGLSTAQAAETLTVPVRCFLHQDHIGSIQLVTGSVGERVERVRYKVFGEIRWSDDVPPASEHTFTGHVSDPDTGLIYMNARHYDPELGQFLTFDPAESSMSPYEYAGNNPVGFVDPTGEFLVPAEIALAFANISLGSTIAGAFTAATQLVSAVLGGGDLGAAMLGATAFAATLALGQIQSTLLDSSASLASQRLGRALYAVSVGYGGYGAVESIRSGNVALGVATAVLLVASVTMAFAEVEEAGGAPGEATGGAFESSEGSSSAPTNEIIANWLTEEYARLRNLGVKRTGTGEFVGGFGVSNDSLDNSMMVFGSREARAQALMAMNQGRTPLRPEYHWKAIAAYSWNSKSWYFSGAIAPHYVNKLDYGYTLPNRLTSRESLREVVTHEVGHVSLRTRSEARVHQFVIQHGGLPQ